MGAIDAGGTWVCEGAINGLAAVAAAPDVGRRTGEPPVGERGTIVSSCAAVACCRTSADAVGTCTGDRRKKRRHSHA